jgi:biotin carboxylase
MVKKIMILQAGPSQVRIINIAREMGLKVVAADRNPDAPGLKVADEGVAVDIVDEEGILKSAKKLAIDGILPGGDVSLPTAAYVAREMGLVGVTPDQAKVATNKEKYYEKFRANGVPIPEMRVITGLEDAVKASRDIGFPLIIKPATSFGGSRGVIRVNHAGDLESSFAFARNASINGRVIVEEFLDGEEHTVESIIHRGKSHVLAISDKERIKESYCVATSLNYPSQLPQDMKDRIRDISQKAADALGLKDWITHIEVITDGDRVKLIDFGARGGGAGYIPSIIVTNVAGINMMGEFIKILLGEKDIKTVPLYQKGVVYRFLTPPPGKIVDIVGIDEVRNLDGFIDMNLNVQVGETINPMSTQLDRAGHFVVGGNTFAEAMDRAKQVERILKIITRPV